MALAQRRTLALRDPALMARATSIDILNHRQRLEPNIASPREAQSFARHTNRAVMATTAYCFLPSAYCLLLSYSRLATNFTRSLTLHEYPHSLSYHAVTFTHVPSITLVKPASTIEECGLPRKSTETSSSVENSMMPLSGPSAALRSASFTSSVVVRFSTKATRSTRETLGTGTRMA